MFSDSVFGEHGLDNLLGKLCVEWGFCLPLGKHDEITRLGEIDANSFALAVLRAEGFDHPESEVEWKRRLRNRFIEHFGQSQVKSVEFDD